jgi:rRNA maturation endonuclease Nob1
MLNNSLKWVAKLAKQIKVDFSTFVSEMIQIFNTIYVDKYYEYNCRRCGRKSTVELCKSCDF